LTWTGTQQTFFRTNIRGEGSNQRQCWQIQETETELSLISAFGQTEVEVFLPISKPRNSIGIGKTEDFLASGVLLQHIS
jgi:hypothetical protein